MDCRNCNWDVVFSMHARTRAHTRAHYFLTLQHLPLRLITFISMGNLQNATFEIISTNNNVTKCIAFNYSRFVQTILNKRSFGKTVATHA